VSPDRSQDKTVVIYGGRRYSYRQLAERSWRLANALRSAGLGKGDRVATLLFNSLAMLEAHFGAPAAGRILVTVNHRLASAGRQRSSAVGGNIRCLCRSNTRLGS
jgi:acyl-CoA synthetase (AMP-forming)/AMP-acid ligase II